MGMLVDGIWFDDDPLPADRGGAFLRPDSSFRDRVSRDDAQDSRPSEAATNSSPHRPARGPIAPS